MKQLHGDIVLVEGNNQLNIELAPLEVPTESNLYGVVYDSKTNLPLSGVSVIVAGVKITFTNSQGQYSFEGLTPGSYSVYFAKDNYLTEKVDVTLTVGNNELNFGLTPTIAAIVGIRVKNPPPRAYYWRYSLWFDATGRGTDVIPIDQMGYVDRKGGFLTYVYFYDSSGACFAGMQSHMPGEEYPGMEYRPKIYITEWGLYEYDWAAHTLKRIG